MDILSFILTRKPRNSNFLSISIREIHLTGKLKPSIRITNLVYKPYVVAQAYLKIQDRFSHYYTILAFLPHPSLNCLFLPREAAPVGFLNSDGREYTYTKTCKAEEILFPRLAFEPTSRSYPRSCVHDRPRPTAPGAGDWRRHEEVGGVRRHAKEGCRWRRRR